MQTEEAAAMLARMTGRPWPTAEVESLCMSVDEVLESASYPFRTSREKIAHDELRNDVIKLRAALSALAAKGGA
jgi:hypothetical protein